MIKVLLYLMREGKSPRESNKCRLRASTWDISRASAITRAKFLLLLQVTKAEYGEYSLGCNGACCGPHPYDCTENMTSNNQPEWIALKLACDNQTSCNYSFGGTTFADVCTPAAFVDYLHIYYTCGPGQKESFPPYIFDK